MEYQRLIIEVAATMNPICYNSTNICVHKLDFAVFSAVFQIVYSENRFSNLWLIAFCDVVLLILGYQFIENNSIARHKRSSSSIVNRSLRSSSLKYLSVPKCNTVSYVIERFLSLPLNSGTLCLITLDLL